MLIHSITLEKGGYMLSFKHSFELTNFLKSLKATTSLFTYRYGRVMFVAAGDDLKWCEENLVRTNDTVLVDKGTPIQDMALLASFENQIYSHGTFSLWICMLSKASKIIYPAPYEGNRYFQHQEFDRSQDCLGRRLVMMKF